MFQLGLFFLVSSVPFPDITVALVSLRNTLCFSKLPRTQPFFPNEQLNEGLLEGFPGEVANQRVPQDKMRSRVHQTENFSVMRLLLARVFCWFVLVSFNEARGCRSPKHVFLAGGLKSMAIFKNQMFAPSSQVLVHHKQKGEQFECLHVTVHLHV